MVVFNQWPKLYLGFDAEPEILKVVSVTIQRIIIIHHKAANNECSTLTSSIL